MSLLLPRPLFSCFFALTVALLATAAQAAAPPAPTVAARAWLLVDYTSGLVLATNNPDTRMEPASLTKIMTAYVVFEQLKAGKIKLEDQVLIGKNAWAKNVEGSNSFIEVGTRVPLETLLKGMIIQSGNDAAIALSEHVAGTEPVFAAMMNEQAKRLGMLNTHFVNATGLPAPDHYTTARDLAALTHALIQDFPEHYAWHAIKSFTYNRITQPNRNDLLFQDPTVDGVKTGHSSSAGYCLIASAVRGKMRLTSVVLGADTWPARVEASKTLLNYGFQFYETHPAYNARAVIATPHVWKGETDSLPVGLAQAIVLTVPRGEYKNILATMTLEPNLTAPITAGQTLGALVLTLEGREITRRPLVALQAVNPSGFFSRTLDAIRMKFQK